jgi:2-dehydropantoate 2-reductase
LGSATILLGMWEKWVFLAALAGSTCLMRAAVGDICAAPGGAGYQPSESFLDGIRPLLTAPGSPLNASMLRGRRDQLPEGLSILPLVYTHLKAYEARRARSARAD